MKLYSYWRSSAAYRVRIALNLKGLRYEYRAVNLLKGEHKDAAYLAVNPLGLVPALELDDGRTVAQSTAIIHWLESEYPTPALLPDDNYERARVLAMANTVACDIHPLNNMSVLAYLREHFGAGEEQTTAWMHTWLQRGFDALEAQVAATPYCNGLKVSMADVLLVPMVYNALRFNYDMAGRHPQLYAVWQACNELKPFIDAQPENQTDAINQAAP